MDKQISGEREAYAPYVDRVVKKFLQTVFTNKIDQVARQVFVDSLLGDVSAPLKEYDFIYQCHLLAASDNIGSFINLINFLITSGRHQKALELIEKMEKKFKTPENSLTLTLCLAEVFLTMGRYADAETILYPFVNLYPDNNSIFEMWVDALYLNDTLWETIRNQYPSLSNERRWYIDYRLGRTKDPLFDIGLFTLDDWGYALYADKNGLKDERDCVVQKILVNKSELRLRPECIELIRTSVHTNNAVAYTQHALNQQPYHFPFKYLYHCFRRVPQVFKEDFLFQYELCHKFNEEGSAVHLMALASTVPAKNERAKTCLTVLNQIDYKTFKLESLYQLFWYLKESFFDDALFYALKEVSTLNALHLPLQILYGRALLLRNEDADGAAAWIEYLLNKNPYSIGALEFLADYYAKINQPEKELVYLYRLREIRTLGHVPLTIRIIRTLSKIDPQKASDDATEFLKIYQSGEVVKELIKLVGGPKFFDILRSYVIINKSNAEIIWKALKTFPNFRELALEIPSIECFYELIKLKSELGDYPTRIQDLELLSTIIENRKERTLLASHYISEKKWDQVLELFPHIEFEQLLEMVRNSNTPGAPRVSTLLQRWTRKRLAPQSDIYLQSYIRREDAEQIWLNLKSLPNFQEQLNEIPRDHLLTEFIKLRSFIDDSPELRKDLEFLAINKENSKVRARLALYYYTHKEPSKAEALFPEVESSPEIVKHRTAFLIERSQHKTIIEISTQTAYLEYTPFRKALAHSLIENKRFQEALKIINASLKDTPENGDLLKLKVKALIGMGINLTLAEDIVVCELKKDPKNKAFKKLLEEVQKAKTAKKDNPPLISPAPPEAAKGKDPKKTGTFKSGLIEDKPVSKREKFPEKFLIKPTTDENVIRASFGSMAGQVDPLKPVFDLKAIKAEAAKAERQALKEEKKTVERTVKPVAAAKVIAKTDLQEWIRAGLKYGADKLDEIQKLEQSYDLLQDPLKDKIRFNNGLYAIYRSCEPISRGVADPILRNKLNKMRNNARHFPYLVAQKDMSELFAYFKSKNMSEQLREWAGETGVLTSLVLNNPIIEIQEESESDEELLLRIEEELKFMMGAKGKEEDFSSRTFHVNALKASLSIIGDASKKLSKPLKEKIGHLFKDFRREGDLIAHFEMNEHKEFNEISPESLWKLANQAEKIIRDMKASFTVEATP